MKKLIFHIAFASLVSFANAQNWQWAVSETGYQISTSIATDNVDNSYVTGYYGADSMFIIKYNANGNVLWAKGTNGEGFGITTDANGNVYATGAFQSAYTSFGNDTIWNPSLRGTPSVFIVKYDGSGNVFWAKSAGGTCSSINYTDYGYNIATDGSGHLYVTGKFNDTIIFSNDSLICESGTIGSNVFIAKYDTSGNELWAKSAKGDYYDAGNSVATDANGNIFVAGQFSSSSITFGTTTLINASSFNDACLFIVKYDTLGNVLWAKTTTGSGSNHNKALSVATDASGNAYITGYFGSDSITFDTITLYNTTSYQIYDMFLVKYNAAGNVVWARRAGGIGHSDYGTGIAIDDNGNVYVTGVFVSPYMAFGDDTLINTYSACNTNMFIVKYDSSGNVLCAVNAGGPHGVLDVVGGNSIATDKKQIGSVCVTGIFNNPSAIFGSYTLNYAGTQSDVYVAKYNCDIIDNIVEQSYVENIKIFPNPTENNLTIESPQSAVIEITNIQGQLLKTFTTTGNKTNIDVSSIPSGVYVVEVKTENGIAVKKFVKE